jgi:hypothetical protein
MTTNEQSISTNIFALSPPEIIVPDSIFSDTRALAGASQRSLLTISRKVEN